MKKKILFCLVAMAVWLAVSAQNCNDKRFTEVNFFSRANIVLDSGVYATARNISGQQQRLKYNIWSPKPGIDPLPRRPFILLVHGGGFVGGLRRQLDTICLLFARRGFVAATIDYRLQYDVQCRDTLTKVYAIYRALQDAHAAMRFFVANATGFRIDTSKLVVGGGSAGAGTILNLVYASQDEVDRFNRRIRDSLGRLDTSGNGFRVPFRIKGVFNNWGGLQRDYFDAVDAVPMISFHGEGDAVVDIDFEADVDCLSAPPITWGSRTLHNQLVAARVCSDITVPITNAHGVFDDAAGKEFRVSKAACFFKSLFCGGCTTVYTNDTIPANCSTQAAGPSFSTTAPTTATVLRLQQNPITDRVAVDRLLANGATRLQVFDLAGRLMAESKGSHWVQVQTLPPGVYLLQVHNRGLTEQIRFVKQ
jgi:hypothetical protein